MTAKLATDGAPLHTDFKRGAQLCDTFRLRHLPRFVLFLLITGCGHQTSFPAPPPTTAASAVDPPVLETTVEKLGVFPFEEDHPVIPDRIKALDGTIVRISGNMIPLDQAEKITRFAIVPVWKVSDPRLLPPIQRSVIVDAAPGKVFAYSSDPIVAQGRLNVRLIKEDGYLIGIFALEATSVTPIGK